MELMGSEPVPCSEFELVFPPGHDLSKLQALWAGDVYSMHPVRLSLLSNLPEGRSLPVPEPAEELNRLQLLLNHISHVRLGQLLAQSAQGGTMQADEGSFLFISSNKMAAWLLLFPPVGDGQPLSAAQLHWALMDGGVIHGINWKLLRQLPNSPQRYFHLFPVALGTQPIPGRDGYVVDRYPRSLEGDSHVAELDQANYQTLKLVQEIQEGDVICEIHPPMPGIPGHTVTGDPTPAPEGQAATVPQGRNTRLSENGKFLLADRSGHLCFSGRSFQVKPVLHLFEEDLSPSQRVKFLGDIHIHSDLRCGVSVCASGNIQIDGAIEACSVEAGENIIVSSGVQGQDLAVLHAQKCVYAKYLEHCTVYAQDSVQADCIINSDVYSNGTVQVHTGRGVLIGGTVRAALEVKASTVGSKAERPTHVILGGQPCDEAQRVQILAELDSITRLLTQLEHLPADPARGSQISKLRLNQCVAKMKLEKCDKDLETQRLAALERSESSTRIACGTVYPGTTVTIGHTSFRVTQVKQNCTIGFSNGLIDYL